MNGEPDYTSGNYAAFNEEPTETESESNIQEFIENKDMNANEIKKTSRKQRRPYKGGKKRSMTGKKRSMTGKKRSYKNR